jgi:hypothetical protein
MEEVKKFCREHYKDIIKSKDKVKWLHCLKNIDSIIEQHMGTEFINFWVDVEKYMSNKYSLLFKK